MTTEIQHHRVAVSAGEVHVAQSGQAHDETILFLHGWPQDWSAWSAMIAQARGSYRCVAIDLPGIGDSHIDRPNGGKAYLAGLVSEVVDALQLQNVTIVGHDAGGMIAYAALRQRADLLAVVIMDTVIPGVPPWQKVLANPYVWHFAFHAIPALPETLVRDNIRAYFDYFFNAISATPDAIPHAVRQHYADSYASDAALSQGFELYRSLPADAAENSSARAEIDTPMLYLRGSREGGDLDEYAAGLRAAGIRNLTTGSIAGAGHFAPEEAPEAAWEAIMRFLRMQ